MKQSTWFVISMCVFTLFGLFVLQTLRSSLRSTRQEGFASTPDVETIKNSPELASYALLKSVMKPIRNLSGILLDPSNWKERISMVNMTPTELARMYLNSNRK
jgi:hypothetical protein